MSSIDNYQVRRIADALEQIAKSVQSIDNHFKSEERYITSGNDFDSQIELPEKKELSADVHIMICKFINECAAYFVTMHVHRGIFNNFNTASEEYRIADEIVQKLLQLYELKLPYLMRNPDFKITVDWEQRNGVEEDISMEVCKILEPCYLELNNSKSKLVQRVNLFLECLFDAWKEFKLSNKICEAINSNHIHK